ncbi:glutathione S-transferase family protein [Erythrobacter litoralis]|uniref:Glutathione S-transferase family protein n=1 Tax=Erythrobacter litoralis (strain HTCC2594) TaxID=314225 RepID=Q2NB68_ERYLH|nr:glutathione S-transferase family protein [Erythrobacter litoralis]ABC63073.1 glutathione S-transferase family protein [Erythrobacter litoralis HTCC2594]
MLFYDSPNPAPNPRRVRIFAAEKGIELPSKQVSIIEREQKSDAYLKINPRGQTPALETDDGEVITESVAICRYLEALHPDPPLFGTTPLEIAHIEQWCRRVEMILMPPIGAVWVHTHPFTARLPGRNAEWGEANRLRVEDAFRFFDTSLEGREFLATDRYTMADILLVTTMDFAKFVGCGAPDDCAALHAWHDHVSARPSAAA